MLAFEPLCFAKAALTGLVTIFMKLCPELHYKYSTLKTSLATVCREFDLGDSHWPGDCANGLLTVFLHLRRIFADKTKWRQATMSCTQAQVNRLLSLAAMYDGPKAQLGPRSESSRQADDAPTARRQLAREVSAASVDSERLLYPSDAAHQLTPVHLGVSLCALRINMR